MQIRMHLILAFATQIFSLSVHASPLGSLRNGFNLMARDPSTATPDDVALCEGPLTPERWTELGYGNIMRDMLRAGYEAGLDRSPNQVILDSASRMDQFFCSFNDTVNVNCDAQDIGNRENCEIVQDPPNDPRAMSMLITIANFAGFIMSTANAARDAMLQADLRYQEFIDTFQVPRSPLPSLGALGVSSSPFILLASVLGALPGIGGLLGIPLGLLISLNNPLETAVWEPRFDEFADARAEIGNLGRDIAELVRRAGDIAVNAVPATTTGEELDTWLQGPNSLPSVLEDGRYTLASSRTAGTLGTELMRGVLNSALINKIWMDSGIYVVRMSPTAYPALGSGADLCGPHSDSVPFDPEVKWCDDDGYMYVLQRWNGQDQSVPGWADLGKFNSDLATVFRNSWLWQLRWGFGREIDQENVQALYDLRVAEPDVNPLRFQMWTLPVCNLDDARTPNPLDGDTDWVECEDHDDPSACMFKLQTMCRCSMLEGWPLGEEAPDLVVGGGMTTWGMEWRLTCNAMQEK